MSTHTKYKLLFSKGIPLVKHLLNKSRPSLPIALLVSKNLFETISKKNEEITFSPIPSNLQLAYVDSRVNLGLFLKPEASPLEIGTFIGIYAGELELVKADPGFTSTYACEIATGISLAPNELKHVVGAAENLNLDSKEKYSIQVNASETGNFTRFINHSLTPNIKALLSKLPNGSIEILFFVLKKIKPGEQLLLNYGIETWETFDIIPHDMTPSSYMLNSDGTISALNTLFFLENFESRIQEELSLKLALLKLGYCYYGP